MVDGTNARASITERVLSDATSTWVDALSYHPKRGPQAPQTRYCYKMMMDIVCYDSVQPELTAKLVGYQDSNQISWVQPGGGSLGASGGAPVAYDPAGQPVSYKTVYKVKNKLNGTAIEDANNSTGIIQTMDLPPVN